MDRFFAPQTNQLNESLQAQALEAVAEYIEIESIEWVLVQAAQSLTQVWRQLQHKSNLNQTDLVNACTSLEHESNVPPEGLFDLSDFSQLLPNHSSSLNEQLNNRVSNSFRPEILACGQQLVEAVSNFIERSAVESSLNSSTLNHIVEQLSRLQCPQLTARLQQIEATIFEYQAQLQSLVQAQAIESLASAIINSHDLVAIDEVITPDFQQLVQDLAEVGRSRLTEQLQQIETVIEQVIEQQHQQGGLKQTNNQPTINSSPQNLEYTFQQESTKVHQLAGEIETAVSRSKTSSEVVVTPTALDEQQLRQVIATTLDQLSERDFYLLYSNVVEYFRAAPPRPPAASQMQQVNNQVEQMDRLLERLYQVQAQQQAAIAARQKNLFHNFDRKYYAASAAQKQL